MKKLMALLIVFTLFGTIAYAEGNEVEVTIPEFGVMIGGEAIDNEHNEFPLIVYKDITYFPMTWNFSRSLGLSSDWDNETGLTIEQSNETEMLVQDKSVVNDLTKTYTASVADFGIDLNGNTINNNEEEYPILLFRDVTYFPLTWKFTVDEFGWESGWDDSEGLSIVNNNIQTTINIDESNNNTTDVSNINDSSVVVNNNNVDNSVNDSNNVYNDYSTTIVNNIDNSVTIGSSDELLNGILDSINELKDAGITSGDTEIFVNVVDSATKQPIENAIVYLNGNAFEATDITGKTPMYVYKYVQYTIKIEKEGYDKKVFVDSFKSSESLTIELNKAKETNVTVVEETGIPYVSGTLSMEGDAVAEEDITLRVTLRKVLSEGGTRQLDSNTVVLEKGQNSLEYFFTEPSESADAYAVSYYVIDGGSNLVAQGTYNPKWYEAFPERAESFVVDESRDDIDIVLASGKAVRGTLHLPIDIVAPAGGFNSEIMVYAENDFFLLSEVFTIDRNENAVEFEIVVPEEFLNNDLKLGYDIYSEFLEFHRSNGYYNMEGTVKERDEASAVRWNTEHINMEILDY